MARIKEFDRDTALRQAMRTFWTKGYDGTSISDLTETMGLSRSSLYETFGGKDDLFLEAVQHYTQRQEERRAAILADSKSAKRALKIYFQGVVDFTINEKNPGGCLVTNSITALGNLDQRVQTVIEEGLDAMEEDFYRCLERGQRSGEIEKEKDCRALARFLAGLVRGISVMARIKRERRRLEEIAAVGLQALE